MGADTRRGAAIAAGIASARPARCAAKANTGALAQSMAREYLGAFFD